MRATDLAERLNRLPAGTIVDTSMDGCVVFELPPLKCGCTPAPWGDSLGEALEKTEECLTPCKFECDNTCGEICETCGHHCRTQGGEA